MSNDTIIGAIIALSSGIAGAFLQAIVSRRSEYIKVGRQARYDAYADYFKGIAQLSHGSDLSSAHALIADARGRIALYGSKEVVVAMSKAFEHGPDIQSVEAREDLSSMLAAMRADVLWIDPAVPKPALVSLLFGSEKP
ncbi:hypothetical protein E5A73_04050 [Sphingomonas gei]|uniref:Uncharacterized protein n=1 Tax=Sphingomonas gei TaxID=1395960 RepID=A0A4S1XLY2_9SPHN|nr:hypothetical protein [Sphingomonas gei]TGX56266.1 hypothetical protein E5A73_04050 [Sphingomonas gei]